MNSLVALQGQTPQINPVGAYQNAKANAVSIKGEQQRQAMQGMEVFGSVALGALNGDINGQADPQRWEQGLDFLAQHGIDVEAYRGRPELARNMVNASMTTMQQLQNARSEQELELATERFERSIFESDRSHGLAQQQMAFNQAQASRPEPMAPPRIETRFNEETGTEERVQWDAATGTWKPFGGTERPDNSGAPSVTPAQAAVDRAYADEYQQWRTGGATDVEKQVGQLEDALSMLNRARGVDNEGNDLPEGAQGNVSGPGVGLIPDFLQSAINPDAVNTREMVEEVVQRNLRLILGAQFTEREGQRLIERAYNPRLDEAENARRVERLLQQIRSAANAKEQAARYFEANGTLAGWNGQPPTIQDFENAIDGNTGNGSGGNSGVVDFSEYFR